jgi:hypothetical protein
MKLSDVSKPRTVTVDFGDGDELNVTYFADRLTPRIEADLSSATDSAQMVGILLLVVSEWDLLEDDGVTPVPLTEERLRDLPLIVLAQAIRAVSGDLATSVKADSKN